MWLATNCSEPLTFGKNLKMCMNFSCVFFKNLFIWTRSHASKLISEAAFLISSGRISCLKVLTFCFYRKAFYILVKWLIKHDILTISEFLFLLFWALVLDCAGENLCSNNLEQNFLTKQKKQYGNLEIGLVSNCMCVFGVG